MRSLPWLVAVGAHNKTSTRLRRLNRVRIIGGVWRSRVIRFVDLPDLRPTPDRVRETLFNWLGQDLIGMYCLDLYAGSGALGFESLSRGASWVTMVERSPRACRALQDNATQLGARNLNIVCSDALEFLASASSRAPASRGFDLVFLDPPFGEGIPKGLWTRLIERLSDTGLVYVESDAKFAGCPRLELFKYGRSGAVHHHLLGRKRNDQGRISGDV
ncbi:MAG: 16S rRNA (guanine(966)-N(2))-methyltransferase RsmD [Betaproteobacteria bacterium RIFCSPLOWO2_12_FULL_63_13]|nr:MAG: 16S rRNA (guanine(966)-N(2))-methyltransferase RsmD [Betaproteobacteria bacterium RIFCSPLOWO2_02_FULL_63_19]OGA43683.1 MAG: 16S rRNA (guanine(966)-N(2))-methyltransferase RsmD [Betaproteobacteria bacterium RIFCSPLOWO2_12_FULL_63_13]